MSTPPGPTVGDRLRSFAVFVWNHDEKKFLGRGARSWAEIGVFYLIYYTCLAGFFTGMGTVFYKTLDAKRPRLTGDSSLLKGNPGMGFQPMPDVEYSLIRFKKSRESYKDHVDSIKKVLKPYIQAAAEGGLADCAPYGTEAVEGQACAVNIGNLMSGCNEENDFGYGLDPPRPCVLLRLNKIFDWMPREYSEEDLVDSGFDMRLQRQILHNPSQIYIQCVGENPADKDNLGTDITYYPTQGYPHFYYPYRNQDGYLAPLVFVQFNSVKSKVALMEG
nr:hypothetical protein BaRGS_009744 [Batillaria attramentaria]